MISWIQKYFQQHFRVIFAVLLAVVVVSFVFTFGPSGGIGRADRQVFERHFFKYNLNDARDHDRIFGDGELSARLQFGPLTGVSTDEIQAYAYQRAAALHLADEWHIPPATDAEITSAIKNLRSFQGQDGQFDAKAYDTFRLNLKTDPRGATEADFKRILSDNVRIEKTHKLLGGPGYVLSGDIKNQLLRTETTWTISTAAADYTAFKTDVKPTEAELTTFFEENSFRYELPPRVVVSYVEFPTTTFLNQVHVTDEEVRAFYDQNPARFPKPADVKPAVPNPAIPTSAPDNADADFASVRPQVEAALKLERAQKLALKAASDFAVLLFDSKVTPGPTLETFIAARKLTLKSLAPFSSDAPPAELGGSPDVAAEAFKLNESRFASEPIQTPGGAAILFWKETQPSRKPLFNEVRDTVATHYTEIEKRKRFSELGKKIKQELESRLAAGDTFEKAADAASRTADIKIETKTLAPFTMRTRPQDLDYSVMGALDRLQKGKISDMIVTDDKGIFVYAADKKAPDLTEANPRYVEARTQIANYNARMTASSYLTDMVQKELKRSEPKAE